jgi:hypothetical protein
MFRIMRRDDDGFPTLGASASTLGVRVGADIDVDEQGNAVPNHKGMSVAPEWRMIHIFLIPRRLLPGGRGSGTRHCFRRGTAAFRQAYFGDGLELLPDSPGHGVVRPAQLVPLAQYEAAIAATREEWVIDEA